MAQSNSDYLRFSANSMKELITRKLSEDSKFTDQIYEGSNLAILIDIVSYMYQCLVYQLNNAASESMFSDTQAYENIVRLVKFIGYQPKGASASTITTYVNAATDESIRSYSILPYSYIDTGLADAHGNKICFSTSRNMANSTDNYSTTLTENNEKSVQLYNGQWKLYSTVFTASGIDNETFVLDGIQSDSSLAKYVAHNFIDIYVASVNENGNLEFNSNPWTMDKNGIFTGYESGNGGLFNNETAFKSLYPGDEQIYTVYLNQDKTYELKFGNGIVGKKLNPGDKIYVFYLETNGPDGEIDINNVDISTLKFKHNAGMFGMSQTLYEQIFQIDSSDEKILSLDDNKELYQLSFVQMTSTTPSVEQSVEEIKEDAPLWFTTGNRLVTKFDYEYYLKNMRNFEHLGCEIVDVECMNNWKYMATFYKWLYDLGANGKLVQYKDIIGRTDIESSHTRYLQKSWFTRFDYFYADAADANNIYLWIKSSDSFDVQTVTANMNNILNPIKLMTAELVVCKAIDVYFDICAAPVEYVLQNYVDDDFDDSTIFDENGESYIEITLDDNALYVPNSLQKDIYDIIMSAFNVNRCQLGQAMKYDDILNSIYQINGVQKVRTIFQPSDSSIKSRSYDGLSFASWSYGDGFIETGDDMNVSNTIRQLEDFQFPVFYGSNTLMNKIKIVKKSLSTVNTIKF